MAIEIHVPDIGGDDVEVVEILVNVGDSVEAEQSLITVEGDKASMEIPATEAGIVKCISIKVGDTVSTGSLIMEFEPLRTGAAEKNPVRALSEPQSSPQSLQDTEVFTEQEISVPDIGSDEVEVTEILVAIGDKVEKEQSLITVEGDKASMEIPAPFSGEVSAIKIAVGDKVSTGTVIMVFEISALETKVPESKDIELKVSEQVSETKVEAVVDEKPSAKALSQAANEQKSAVDEFVENAQYAHASPVVRRIAREFGVNLGKVKGTGPKTRILKEDVQAYVKEALGRLASGTSPEAKGDGAALGLLPWPSVDFSKFGDTELLPLSRIKKISGANLHRNWVMIPHITQFDSADITELEAFRKEQNALEAKKDTGIKITPLVFIMKAVAKSLEAFPTFNASLSAEGDSLILKKYIHIGIAVDTPNGLVVPVFTNVNKKGIHALSVELLETSKKARAGKLAASEMQGGCFTISSLGGIGGTAFTPIINAPEVAILGVSKSEIKPVWNGKEFVPRLHLPLSLSYDHRVIDGAEGARFVTFLNECLSDIRRLIL